ncbi:hypothetical protein WS62_22520 [Burkholderia sp. ABCPW 14]|uniref:Major surface protein 3 n=2 Tax=pseudomallei group TaxID=111527 RepID=A0A1B4FST8_9BURK|nr:MULTISPECIES: hypothetical protein [Burkholderia]AIO69550.1 hypothetical protein DM82_4733 [Burkholderia oklahomensis]AJX35385.1 putative major surface protein 3 [Burkholderia oklahomensis C6786]AOI39778.1 hypothetical protein WG70_09210 [Burkholderia oklahomensis EO147]AOI49462.1 hypothetical protein WI23_27290 [Burkholderia oklahomensis C6786]AOJ06754.1 hypothetical protein WS71_05025 [Burkholderia mayonis]
MTNEKPDDARPHDDQPKLEQFEAAVDHLHESIQSQSIAAGAAKGILFSLIETLGALVGDPDLPEHARSGYEALRDKASELKANLEKR